MAAATCGDNAELIDAIRKMAAEGHTMDVIAEKTGYSYSHIKNLKYMNGIVIANKKMPSGDARKKPDRKPGEKTMRIIEALKGEYKSLSTLGKMFGTSKQNIGEIKRKYVDGKEE